MHRDPPIDNRHTSNVLANRLKPLLGYPNPNGSNAPAFEPPEHRPPSLINRPPTSFPQRSGSQLKKDPSDVDHLTKLLMKSMNSSNEANFFGKFELHLPFRKVLFERHVCSMQWRNRRRRKWTRRNGSNVPCVMFYMHHVRLSSAWNAFLFHGKQTLLWIMLYCKWTTRMNQSTHWLVIYF